jgi:superfamily II DNA helicase RecQ
MAVNEDAERDFAEQRREMIEIADDRKEPNEWLDWIGWAAHLEGLDPSQLHATMDPISEDEPRLLLKWHITERVIDQARAIANAKVVGAPVLFEVQRSNPARKPPRPITNRLEDDTWRRYKENYRKIISIVERTEAWPEDKRPPWRATKMQRQQMAEWDDAIDRFIEARARQHTKKHIIGGRFTRIHSPSSDGSDTSSSDDDYDNCSVDAGTGWQEIGSVCEVDETHWDQTEAETNLESICLSMLMSWFDHTIGHDPYANIIISSLAVMGIKDERQGGWESPLNFTPVYSGIIKVARYLVLLQSWREWEDEVNDGVVHAMESMHLASGPTQAKQRKRIEQDVREETRSIFSIVRNKVRRFMTRTSDSMEGEPTPMDWMFEARAYGMKIRYNTAAPGTIDWDGSTVVFRDIKLTMAQLTLMLRDLIREARTLLAELTMVPGGDVDYLPRIPWDKIEDIHSRSDVGYSFMTDERNTWVAEGKDWVLKQITQSSARLHEWIKARPGNESPFQEKAVRQYAHRFKQFRERLFMLMHMMSLPARSPEISSIRFRNTTSGGVRNIFVDRRMVCFVTSYHKGFRNSGVSKIIHRYMPREVGSLMVWYLWLVLPWWQKVQSRMPGVSSSPSAFMWADDVMRQSKDADMSEEEEMRMAKEGVDDDDDESMIARQEKARRQREGSQHGSVVSEASEASEDGSEITVPREWKEEETWTNDHIRRILTSHSERLTGARITISAWRQIAVAIARRYLGGAFGTDETGGADPEEVDPDADDDPADLQVGHGSLVAGMIYARELQQATFGTDKARDKFRAVSRAWHRFLGFGDEDQKTGIGSKRRREPYDAARDAERMRRMRMMRNADIHGSLGSMVGPGAEFRGQQERVIRSIMQEGGPFIQITGTGGGKSMSFMLPAYCVPGGTSIVIVPLVALRDDLRSRCKELGIASIIWQRDRGNPPATIVFVTPETAVTKGFRDWVNGVVATGQLDRVVVDECHVLLDGSEEFRNDLTRLGGIIREWGVQRVFLTATLPPEDMDAFHQAAALDPARTTVFRERTTRPNIRYKVITVTAKADKTEEAEDDKVCELVKQWRQQHSSGRVMVYAVERERVDRLARRLGCPAYHSRIGSKEKKMQRLQWWKDSGDMIVGTKALGLGIDVPDVRLVLHAGMPYQMKDYVQESGRAGRDRQTSEAIMVCATVKGSGFRVEGIQDQKARRKGKKQIPSRHPAAAAYMDNKGCRREIIDQAMDGFVRREGCGEEEEACSICHRQMQMERMLMEVEESDEDVQKRREGDAITQSQFQDARRAQIMVEHEAALSRMTTASMTALFEEAVETWRDRCVVCWENGSDRVHSMEQCPSAGSEDHEVADTWMKTIQRAMFTGMGFAQYSGCFHCGLPQAICQQWAPVMGDERRFQKQPSTRCQYSGVLCKVWAAGFGFYSDEVKGVLQEEGVTDIEDEKAIFHWMGRKRRWCDYETNNMCVVFQRICTILSEE